MATISEKTVVFIRHGCTYMNEYLGRRVSFGAPNFSDVFPDDETRENFYRDSPLSPLGERQAFELLARSKPKFLDHCELIVTSPLRRALQTLHVGLKPHLAANKIPVIALPEAAERLYLISDVGRSVRQMEQEFDYVDFKTGFDYSGKPRDAWWYQSSTEMNYVEWRPSGQGQKYACPGEPQHCFDARMTRLYDWLLERPETYIVVVSHWGVIDWMLDMDFDNCQWKQVEWSKIRPKALVERK